MPLSHDLQNLTADVSAAIAANKPFARTELEVLRRNLNALRRAAAKLESSEAHIGGALSQLADGVEREVADLVGLARHARTLVPATA